MAQNFRRLISRNIGSGGATVHTFTTGYHAIVGIRCANTNASASTNLSVYITDGGVDYYLIKEAPIAAGSSLELIDGGSKIIVESGDILKVVSSANYVDAWVSYIDAIST